MTRRATAAAAREFAARWCDVDGEEKGTTFGGTMCWFPIKPWRLKIVGDGFEHVVPCRTCPGCLEFLRRWLSERLHALFSDRRGKFYLVRIWATLSQHSAVAHRLHRTIGLELEPGLYRLGAGSMGLLSRERKRVVAVLRRWGLHFRIEPIHLRRGRRAWNGLTAGLLVSRAVYGEQTKRWYARGLPRLAKPKWEVVKIGTYRTYDRVSSPRARRADGLVLVPPKAWKMRRTDRRIVRECLARAASPEAATLAIRVVAELVAKVAKPITVSAPPKSADELDRIRRTYQLVAELQGHGTEHSVDPNLTPTPERVGGYVSSEHPKGDWLVNLLSGLAAAMRGPPQEPELWERERQDQAGRKEFERRRTQKLDQKLQQAFQRLRAKITGG